MSVKAKQNLIDANDLILSDHANRLTFAQALQFHYRDIIDTMAYTLYAFKTDVTLAYPSATTDFYSYTIPANTLLNDGDRIEAYYLVDIPSNAAGSSSGATWDIYFNGSSIGTGTIGIVGFHKFHVSIMRISNTIVRIDIQTQHSTTTYNKTLYVEVTGLDLTTNTHILKGRWTTTGSQSANSYARKGHLRYEPAES